MKMIFQNLKCFFKKDKTIFLVTTLCTFISAIIVYFSYGIYQNAHALKQEAEVDLKQIDITPNRHVDESLLTKKQLCKYLDSLSPSLLDNIELIYTSSVNPPYFEKLPEEGGGFDSFHYRFCIRDGHYSISTVTKESWENSGMIVAGRYLTAEEEAEGKNVAMVANPHGTGRKPQTQILQVNDDEIELFGKTYKIVGEYSGAWLTPIIPFLSIPDSAKLEALSFVFATNITRSQYNELKTQADDVLPGILQFPDLDFPGTDTIYVYNNVMLISVLLSLLSAFNFAMLYHYILEKRNVTLAVFRICGCTKNKAIRVYLGECLLLSVPIYVAGAIVYDIIMKRVLSDYFPFMLGAFSLSIYVILFIIYMMVLLCVLMVLIASHVKNRVIDEWRS